MCAASVYPEPGSNSHVFDKNKLRSAVSDFSKFLLDIQTYNLEKISSSSLHNSFLFANLCLFDFIIKFIWVLWLFFTLSRLIFLVVLSTALLVSQSLLFTFQCAFYVISILFFRTLYYCTIFKSICQHFFKSFLSFFHIVFTAKKVQNNKLVFDAFFRFLLTLY